MSYVTQQTIWPDCVALDSKAKDVLSHFYQLADDASPEAGPRMAREVFTSTGKMAIGAGAFEGSDAISHCRDHAWAKVSARRHSILQVFVNDKDGRDLFVLGKAKTDLKNGKDVEQEFTAHVVMQEDKTSGELRVEFMQVYADSAPMVNALKDS